MSFESGYGQSFAQVYHTMKNENEDPNQFCNRMITELKSKNRLDDCEYFHNAQTYMNSQAKTFIKYFNNMLNVLDNKHTLQDYQTNCKEINELLNDREYE